MSLNKVEKQILFLNKNSDMRGFLFIILSFMFFNSNAQKEIELKTEIENVKVFLSGAEITRNSSAMLKAGQNEIVFTGLSNNIEKSAIRLTANPELSVLSINIESNFLTEESDKPRIKSLKDSIKIVANEITLFENEKSAFEVEKTMLLENQEIGGDNTGVSVSELQQAADFYRKRIFEINNRLTEITLNISEKNTKKYKLQRQLDEITSRSRHVASDLYFVVNSDKEQKVNLTLTYFVHNAGWAPRYEFFSKSSKEKIDFKYLGEVYNNTGVDWDNVTVSLSTGDPQISIQKPEMSPWYLQYFTDYKKGSYDRRNYKMEEEAVEVIEFADGDFEGVDDQTNNTQSETVSLPDIISDFKLDDKLNIPSDYKPYRVEISSTELNAIYEHFTIPKVEANAFLLSKVSGWKELGLIEGPVKVYYEGTYMGESYIYPVSVNDTLDISLGRDQKIVVKRDKLKELCSTRSIGSNKKETLVYEIQIKNNRPGDVEITVLDQIPISNTGDMDVEVTELSGGQLNNITGEVKWELSMKPGELKKIQLGFIIKYPKNKAIDLNQGRKKTVTRFY
jgi:uncharacterized protein (TIGR02231 family)